MPIRALLILLLALSTRAAAQAPDFTALAQEAAGSVVSLVGTSRPLMLDSPLMGQEDDEPAALHEWLRRQYPAPAQSLLGTGFAIDRSAWAIPRSCAPASGWRRSARPSASSRA